MTTDTMIKGESTKFGVCSLPLSIMLMYLNPNGRPLKRSGRHENRQGGVYKKISRDSNYISIYFYLKSHEILTIFRTKETLTILGWVLFIGKATRMMKLKTLRNRG